MISIDCPWCETPVHVDGREAALRCDGCSVEVDLAPDDAALEVRRAA